MKLFFDLLPVILFFIAYKLYGIYVATAVIMVACLLQVGLVWLFKRKAEKMHLWMLAAVLVFGAATLLLKNPVFIKWKPSIVNWGLGLVFLATNLVGKAPLVKRMMGNALELSDSQWRRLNLAWVAFFLVCGAANIAVAYAMSENAWVNFKLFGLTGMSFAFIFGQVFILRAHVKPEAGSAEPAESAGGS